MRTLGPRLVLLFALGTAVNYLWELAQSPLYAGVAFPGAVWHCFIVALGDGLLVLLIYAAVAAIMRSPVWYVQARPQATWRWPRRA